MSSINFPTDRTSLARTPDNPQVPEKSAEPRKNPNQAKVDEAAPVLRDVLRKLDLNEHAGWDNAQLKDIANTEGMWLTDMKGTPRVEVTPELREAAQKLLDAGGASALYREPHSSPNNPHLVTIDALTNAIAHGLPYLIPSGDDDANNTNEIR